jgi:hypothetical protein
VQIVVLGRQQLLVAEELERAGCRHMRAVGHQDEMPDGLHLRRQLLDQRQEGQVEEQDLVRRVIENVDQLVDEEPRIDRVADRAYARDRVVELDVPVAVPGQCRDPVAEADFELSQRLGQLLRSAIDLGICREVHRPLDRAGDNLRIRMVLSCVLDQARNQQRPIHHPATHGRLP